MNRSVPSLVRCSLSLATSTCLPRSARALHNTTITSHAHNNHAQSTQASSSSHSSTPSSSSSTPSTTSSSSTSSSPSSTCSSITLSSQLGLPLPVLTPSLLSVHQQLSSMEEVRLAIRFDAHSRSHAQRAVDIMSVVPHLDGCVLIYLHRILAHACMLSGDWRAEKTSRTAAEHIIRELWKQKKIQPAEYPLVYQTVSSLALCLFQLGESTAAIFLLAHWHTSIGVSLSSSPIVSSAISASPMSLSALHAQIGLLLYSAQPHTHMTPPCGFEPDFLMVKGQHARRHAHDSSHVGKENSGAAAASASASASSSSSSSSSAAAAAASDEWRRDFAKAIELYADRSKLDLLYRDVEMHSSPLVAYSTSPLAWALLKLPSLHNASRALNIVETQLPQQHPLLYHVLFQLACLSYAESEPINAEGLFRSIIQQYERRLNLKGMLSSGRIAHARDLELYINTQLEMAFLLSNLEWNKRKRTGESKHHLYEIVKLYNHIPSFKIVYHTLFTRRKFPVHDKTWSAKTAHEIADDELTLKRESEKQKIPQWLIERMEIKIPV